MLKDFIQLSDLGAIMNKRGAEINISKVLKIICLGRVHLTSFRLDINYLVYPKVILEANHHCRIISLTRFKPKK